MIRYRLKERIADREFAEGRRIKMTEIAEETGVNRTTLSKIANQRGYNTTTDVIDRLCSFFGCRVEELIEHIPEDSEGDSGRSSKTNQ